MNVSDRAALSTLREWVERQPYSSGSHYDTNWSDAVGQYNTWHECYSGSGISRSELLAEIDRLRSAIDGRLSEAVDAPSCDCDWMDTGPDYPCLYAECEHGNVRPYRDDARHLDGGHVHRICGIRMRLVS